MATTVAWEGDEHGVDLAALTIASYDGGMAPAPARHRKRGRVLTTGSGLAPSIEVDDGLVVFEPSSGAFLDLDESAAELFVVLSDHGGSSSAVVEHLVSVHGLDVAAAQAIVEQFVADLRGYGVTVPDPG